jgi:hypothetical protein
MKQFNSVKSIKEIMEGFVPGLTEVGGRKSIGFEDERNRRRGSRMR